MLVMSKYAALICINSEEFVLSGVLLQITAGVTHECILFPVCYQPELGTCIVDPS